MEGGDFLWSAPSVADSRAEEAQIRSELIAGAYALVPLDAAAPGRFDLSLGLERLKDLQTRHGIPWIASNLVCDGERPFAARRVVEREGWRVAFLGAVPENAQLPGCEATPPIPALVKAAEDLGPVDLVVVLGPFENRNAAELVEAVPNVDFIVSDNEATLRSPTEIGVGHFLLGAGGRGKKIGVLKGTRIPDGKGWRAEKPGGEIADRIDSVRNRMKAAQNRLERSQSDEDRVKAQERVTQFEKEIATLQAQLEDATKARTEHRHTFSNELVDMSTEVTDHEATRLLVEAARPSLTSVGVPPAGEKRKLEASRLVGTNEGSPFVGSTVCRSCHEAEYRQWRTTDHSKAYATLARQKKHKDPACFSCHVTGAFHPQGPRDPNDIGILANVGCESCHGPLRAHTEQPDQVRPSSQVGSGICLDCHTKPGDPGRFEPESYMAKVRHGASGGKR